MRLAYSCYSFLLLLALACLTALPAQEKKEEEKKKEEAAAPVPVLAAPAEQLDAQALQYEQFFLPHMWQDLDLLKASCELTREQRPKIKAAGLASVKKGAKEFTAKMQKGNHDEQSAMMTIRRDLRKAFDSILTKEQSATYQSAIDRRTAAHKKATLRIVVAELDNLLYLTREQRDKIMQTLDGKWQESWESWLQISQYGGNYVPTVPDEHLTPHLNQQQKTVWQGAQKVSPGLGGSDRAGDQDWWDGKDEPAQAEAADKQ